MTFEEVERELARRCAHLVPHGQTTLEAHLRGVHHLLARWNRPEHVQLAGLLHSAYATESFRFALFGRSERARVRELVGARAERLIFAFCVQKRERLRTVHREEARAPRGLARAELAELLVIHAANVFEQSTRFAEASAFLAAARAAGADALPEFTLTRAAESRLARDYRAGRDPREPCPVGEPFVLAGARALARLDATRANEAATLGARALGRLDAIGAAWDKRLGFDRWRELAELVARDGAKSDRELHAASRRMRGALARASGSPAALWAELDALGAFCAQLPAAPAIARPRARRKHDPHVPERFSRYVAQLRTNAERPLLEFYPGLRAEPWHDPSAFDVVADLERLAPVIATEARAFDEQPWQDEAEAIPRRGRWSVQFLLEMGRRRDDNLARCPTLAKLFDSNRTLTTHAGLAYFSCLASRSRVAPHRGPTNVRLRCHLALEVPKSGCGIRVGGVARSWQPGKCIVFDDSFEHEVWNDSDQRRVVLVLDVWHPDLTSDEIALLAGLHRFGAAHHDASNRYWTRNEAATRAAREPSDIVTRALVAGDLEAAGEAGARLAAEHRATRWYPVRRADDPPLAHDWQPMLTPAKLVHDIEQMQYLRRREIVSDDLEPVVRSYEDLLDTLRPLGDSARVPLRGVARAEVGHVYGRLVHVRPTPRVARALSNAWQPRAVEDEFISTRPSVVVVDDFLTPAALEGVRAFCLESTVWSTNRYDHGRLGAFFRDGFSCSLLMQIAEELRDALPRLIGRVRPLTQLWGYKYMPTQPCLPPHADFAAVNVNFWITPDDANLDPNGGGLLVYDVEAPRDWDFEAYNRNATKIRALLDSRRAVPMHVPYRCNRAVIFDSDLFHATPALRFRDGYENRRINVTALFGDRADRLPQRARAPHGRSVG